MIATWVDDRYLDAAEAARIDANIYHLASEAAELEGVKTLYDARLELEGMLNPADAARREAVVSKMAAIRTELTRLQDQRQELSR